MAMTEARAQQPSSIGRAIAGWSGRGLVERYGIAVIGIALGLALRAALASLLEGSGAYLFYVPAILAASALGGWGPGLFATILGLLSGLFFVTDYRALNAADIIYSFIFVLVGDWRFVARRTIAPLAHRGDRQRQSGDRARSPREAHSRHYSRRHDRDR